MVPPFSKGGFFVQVFKCTKQSPDLGIQAAMLGYLNRIGLVEHLQFNIATI